MQLSFINASIVRNQFTFSNKIKLHVLFAFFFILKQLSVSATPHFSVPTTRTFVVNTTSDTHAATPVNGDGLDNSGSISLRSALEAANAVGGTSIITLSASTYTLSLGAITIGTSAQNITINGVDSSSTIIQMSGTLTDRILLVNPTGTLSGITTTINKVQFRGGILKSDANGGGAIIAGGPLNSLTLNLCEFKNNSVSKNNGEGGAVRFNGGGSLNIDKCIFVGNTDSSFNGGAVSYFLENLAAVGNGALSITNSIFEKNNTLGNGFGGAGIAIAAQGRINGSATFTANILKNNFVSNLSSGSSSLGGAIKVLNEFTSGNNININYNRFFNNNSTIATDALVMFNSEGSVNAINNWWGCNNGPSLTSGCNNASMIGTGYGGTLTNAPYLKLNVSSLNDSVCISNTQTVTAGFLTNSSNTLMDSSNLTALINLPISFTVVNGSVSNVQSVIQNSGTAKFSFTAQSTTAISTINARLDSIALNDPIAKKTINIFGPQITNPVISTGIYGTLFNQNFTQVGGTGTVVFTSASKLPNGITLSSSGNLAGTINEVDTFPIGITATDIKGCTGNSNYTLITYLPTLSVTGSLNLFTACNGTVSTSQSISIQGDHLSDKIIVKAPADFELSRSAGGSYADTLHFAVAGDLTAATVHLRLKSTASGFPSGNVSIESINANTKTKSVSGLISLRPTSVVSGSTSICNGDSVSISITLTGTQPWSVTYTDGTTPTTITGIVSSPNIFKVAPSSTKTYTVTSLSDANCSAISGNKTGSAIITVNTRPTSFITGSATICNGDSASLRVDLAGAQPWNLTYTDGTTPVTVTGIISSPYTFKVAPTSTKTYTVTSLTDANCTAIGVDKTGAAVITVNARPTSLISGSTNLCNGDSTSVSIALTGAQPWNLTYTDGTTPVTVTGIVSSPYTFKVAPTSTKTYTVTSLSDANCTAILGDKTGLAVVSVNTRPTALISGNNTICNGDSASVIIALTGAQPWNLTYTDGTTPTTITGIVTSPYTFKVAPSSTKTYTVTFLSDINCDATNIGIIGLVNITVKPSPRATITGSTSVIKNSSSPEVNFSGLLGISPYTFGYTLNNGPILTASSGLSDNAKLVVPTSIAGTYNYKLVSVQDNNNLGCKSLLTDSVVVKVIDNAPYGLTYDPANLVYNGGDTIKKMIPAAKGGVIDHYEISPTLPAGLIFNTLTGEITGVCNSLLPTKEFTITAYNSGGFTSCKISITINVLPSLSSFNPINAKYGDQDITIISPVTNSDGLFTYSSSNSAVAIVIGNKIKVVGAGVAKITAVQASTNNYLTGSISTEITVSKAILTIKLDDKSKCQGTANPILTYTVSGFVNGDGLNVLRSMPTLITDASTASAVGSYTIMAYGANTSNYEIVYQSGKLLVNPIPYVKVASTYTIVSKGTNVVLNGIGDGQFSWSPLNYLASPNAPISVARVMDKTTYTATVTNQFGCVNTSSVTVDVFDEINVTPAVLFTPNGDGINDKFVIQNIDNYPQNKLQICDRTGKIVYEKTNYQNDWDGTLAGGIKITKETYYYTLSVNGNIIRRGAITLLR